MTYGYLIVDAGLTSRVLDNSLKKSRYKVLLHEGGGDDFSCDDGHLSTLFFQPWHHPVRFRFTDHHDAFSAGAGIAKEQESGYGTGVRINTWTWLISINVRSMQPGEAR